MKHNFYNFPNNQTEPENTQRKFKKGPHNTTKLPQTIKILITHITKQHKTSVIAWKPLPSLQFRIRINIISKKCPINFSLSFNF